MKATFENATIADVIGKACRVAPTKGQAFDKASGIVMSLNSGDNTVGVRATNLNVFYLEQLDAVDVEGEGEWRIPAVIANGVFSKLPIGSGKMVTIEGDHREIVIKSGRITAKVRLSDPAYYPKWDAFDPDILEVVPDLGARIQQIEWCAGVDQDPPMSGIHLNGEYVMATDRIRMAITPCEATPIFRPITIPAKILQPVMRGLRDVAIGIDGGMFLLMPDQSTQIKTVIYSEPYPDIMKVAFRQQPNSIKISKAILLEMVDRAMVFSGSDRSPSLELYLGKKELAVTMKSADQGLLGEVVDLGDQADHKRCKIMFTPKNLTEAVNASPSEQVEICYNPTEVMKAIRVDGGSGYEAWVMPRRRLEGE